MFVQLYQNPTARRIDLQNKPFRSMWLRIVLRARKRPSELHVLLRRLHKYYVNVIFIIIIIYRQYKAWKPLIYENSLIREVYDL